MDVDIDFPQGFDPSRIFKSVIPASMVRNGELVKHNCGHYFQNIPVDSHTGVAAIPYKQAAELGYFKIDFLPLSLLNDVKTKQELREKIAKEPDWDMLLDYEVVPKLFHLADHGDMLELIKPRSVQELADVLAIIRPGKRKYLERYLKDPEGMRPHIYAKEPGNNSYTFKRSHAISYALTIVVQLHMIAEGRA